MSFIFETTSFIFETTDVFSVKTEPLLRCLVITLTDTEHYKIHVVLQHLR